MFSLIQGTQVIVSRPVTIGKDSMGEPIEEWVSEAVENVLFQPGGGQDVTTYDLDADRPNGVEIAVTFHFPKSYNESLRGCKITYLDKVYRVIGNPQPYMVDNTPGDWNYAVRCEAVYG